MELNKTEKVHMARHEGKAMKKEYTKLSDNKKRSSNTPNDRASDKQGQRDSRPSKCLQHHQQRWCKILWTGVNLLLKTYSVL